MNKDLKELIIDELEEDSQRLRNGLCQPYGDDDCEHCTEALMAMDSIAERIYKVTQIWNGFLKFQEIQRIIK